MRKSHVILFLFFAFTISAKAQVYLNPVIGVNSFRLTPTPENGKDSSGVGFTIGLNARFGGRFFLEPGLHFLRQKIGMVFNLTTGRLESKADFSTLRIPLLAGAKLFAPGDGDGLLNAYIHAGITPMILLAASNSETGADVKDEYNTLNLAGTIGGGIELLFFTFEINLDYGLTTANAKLLPSPVGSYSGKPYALQFNFGVKFPI